MTKIQEKHKKSNTPIDCVPIEQKEACVHAPEGGIRETILERHVKRGRTIVRKTHWGETHNKQPVLYLLRDHRSTA